MLPPATLSALRRAATPQRSTLRAAGVVVRHGRGPRAALYPLSVCRDLPADAQPCCRDHARPVHAGVRADRRKDGFAVIPPPGADAAGGVSTTRQASGFSTSPRRSRTGPTPRRLIAGLVLASPRRSSGSGGVSGMVRSNALWISLPKPSLQWTLQPTISCQLSSSHARWRACCAIARLMCPDNPTSSSTTQQHADAKNRFQRRSPRARCNGCCIGE